MPSSEVLLVSQYSSVICCCSAVQVNTNPVNLTATNDYQQSLATKNVNITVHKYRDNMGQTAHLITDLYNLLVYATPQQWDEEAQQVTR